MHSSISDIVPSVNANLKMAEVMLRMKNEFRFQYQPDPLCPQGVTMGLAVMAQGGVYYGILPGTAEFCTDVRTLPGMTRDRMEADLESFFARLREEDPSLDISFEFEPLPLGWIEPVVVPAEHPFVGSLQRATETVLGASPPLGSFPAWTDARFFASVAGIPTIPAFGPGLLTQAHAPNESIPVESIVQAARIFALAGSNFLRRT